MIDLRKTMTWGFEATFSVENWWQEPGFCSEWETPHKLELMERTAAGIAKRLGGKSLRTVDIYDAVQFETFDGEGKPSFVVTSEPGSVEIKTPPVLISDLRESMEVLFDETAAAGFVPYRTWWYGWKSGTQGGCHVNMGGFTPETSPWFLDPLLVVKYFAYFHNRPCLHYPFMGPDVGHGGNCMRMDEQEPDALEPGKPLPASMARFEALREKLAGGWQPTAPEIYEFFKGVPLREVKHSAPTLRKVKHPEFLVEDRAMESLRSAEDCMLVAELRLRILEKLQKEALPEPLKIFGPSLHGEDLGCSALWRAFVPLVQSVGLDPLPYARFFMRQFPPLLGGQGVPGRMALREGRRQRVMAGVHEKKGDLILSKKVDTRHKRFEVFWTDPQVDHVVLNGAALKGIPMEEPTGPTDPEGPWESRKGMGLLFDVFVPGPSDGGEPPRFRWEVRDASGTALESGLFDPNGMMWISGEEKAPSKATAESRGAGYYRVTL